MNVLKFLAQKMTVLYIKSVKGDKKKIYTY